ncbi:NACHT domain-containing protein [Nocardia sp. CA-107356]|uniref:NACHT domain-containing protein n=1 Tax=Nocardia sp. CA-107356 TaxID=3239972 RepID=UPI003D9203E9
MGYLYENSNPDRFQQLCQSLLLREFPGLQCFPIGQPDGGRDGAESDTQTILQVKFKRADEPENAEWVIDALEGELPKINKLIKKGAKKYILATNARGTAHLGGGRIDKVDDWFKNNLEIPAVCMWRDDIDRRMDTVGSPLKLKYSELVTLEDGIEVVYASLLNGRKEHHRDAIRQLVAYQYKADKTLKFKQVDLSNDLLALFVDVPARISPALFRRSRSEKFFTVDDDIENLASDEIRREHSFDRKVVVHNFSAPRGNSKFGAGEVLLNLGAQDGVKRILLEGAPGQGKSTLAQYVCQVHRAKYLRKTELLDRIPESHNRTAFRLPIKVDLRDLASFLEGKSPFDNQRRSLVRPKALEGFLAELIWFRSSGIDLDAQEILTILKSGPILLFLDGLDEVADISLRDRLVVSIADTLDRLDEVGADVQVVITSRPSIFGHSARLEDHGFLTISLDKLDSSKIQEYTSKWVVARKLSASETQDVNNILSEKLELPHIVELTRNPMQLTILLGLIHQVGHSLPDQRTDLYRKYVELFFIRESEKTVAVRENRAVLVGFIGYLAWLLQSQAESEQASGSVSRDQLVQLAREYLESGSHDSSLASSLFGGGLERIFVLVARIEGLYEFEVQPLREYFCAEHLYSTAPVGTYRSTNPPGDRAQRFEAIAANPFWLNVTRFYAGFYIAGEVGSLVMSIKEMIASSDLPRSIHARRVGLALLQDRIFTNKKFAQTELIDAVFDELGVDIFSISLLDDIGTLEPECGQSDLRNILFSKLIANPDAHRSIAYGRMLRSNGGDQLSVPFIEVLNNLSGLNRTRWLSILMSSGAAANIEPDVILSLILEDEPSDVVQSSRIARLAVHEPHIVLGSEELLRAYLDGVLGGTIHISIRATASSELSLCASLLKVSSSSGAFGYIFRQIEALIDENSRHAKEDRTARSQTMPPEVFDFTDQVIGAYGTRYISGDVSYFDFWNDISAAADRSFGPTWASAAIAIRAAGHKPEGPLPKADSLFDPDVPVCVRVRSARMRRGGSSWWKTQLGMASSRLERMIWVGVVSMWASMSNILELAEDIDVILDELTGREFHAVFQTVQAVAWYGELRRDRKDFPLAELVRFSDRALCILIICLKAKVSEIPVELSFKRHTKLAAWADAQRRREEVELEVPNSIEEITAWLQEAESIGNVFWMKQRPAEKLRANRSKSLLVYNEVVKDSVRYGSEILSDSIESMVTEYRPNSLVDISVREGWTFE